MATIKFLEKERKFMEELTKNPALFKKDEDWSFWEDTFLAFIKLVNSMSEIQVLTPLYRIKYEGEEYRQAVAELEEKRARRYDLTVDAINLLNRVSAQLGLEPFADVDTSDRCAVLFYAAQVVTEVFNGELLKEYSLEVAREKLRF